MKFFALRHGLTESNKKRVVNGQGINEPLATEGIEQARAIRSQIPESILHIYSSSLLRAQQTTEIINLELKRSFSIHDEIREVSLGSLEGKTWEEMENGLELKKHYRSMRFNLRPFGGEAVEDVTKRVVEFLKSIEGKHTDHQALIVTHGGIIRLLHRLEHGESPFEVENLSIHEFDTERIIKSEKLQ